MEMMPIVMKLVIWCKKLVYHPQIEQSPVIISFWMYYQPVNMDKINNKRKKDLLFILSNDICSYMSVQEIVKM